ncbi:hypothetical protein P3S67_014664 [Capsicum chacoense]
MNNPNVVFGDLVLKCQLGKSFDELRSIMKKENIDGLFKKSCFAHFLELSRTRPLCFSMIMVYGLLKRRIMYTEDDGGPKKGKNKMDEVWINYYGMPVCFGLKEIAIVTGLRCDHPEEPAIKKTPYKGSNKCKAWACEAIFPLRKYFTDYPDKVSHPRILRWLAAIESSKKNINETDLFNPPDDVMAVGYPWIVPTIDELGMTSFLTLGLVDTKEDPMVELTKKELDVTTSIRRVVTQGRSNIKALYDQTQTATDRVLLLGVLLVELFVMVVATLLLLLLPVVIMSIGPSYPSSPSYSHCKCKVCKDREDKLLDKINTITKAAKDLKSRRGVIPSNEFRGSSKKVDIFAALGKEKRKELEEFIKMKVKKEYTMHSFSAKDFSNMTNMCVWYEDKYIDEILCLIWGRQLAYPDTYDAANRIMDLNFYNNFKDRYDKLYKIADSGSPRFDQLVSMFQWDEEAIKYVRGKRPYPHGKSWTKAKRILAVMNVDVTHFLTVEILLYEENIKVYDCNLPVFSEKMFLTHMQPLLKLLPKLLTQSKMMDHLPVEVLAKES